MLIPCPKCETTFSLADELFRPGRKARCSHCGNIFPMALPETASSAQPGVGTLPPLDGTAVAEKKQRRRMSVILFAVATLCVLGIGLGGWMVFRSFSTSTPVATTPEGKNASAGVNVEGTPDSTLKPDPAAKVRDIDLVDVRQFIVKNDTLGDMVVIKGRAVNNFQEAKRFITVEARLYAQNGTVLAEQRRVCGADPFLTQLQVLTEAGLEEALSNRVEILVNNSNVRHGDSTPFWFVFPPIKHAAGKGEEAKAEGGEGEGGEKKDAAPAGPKEVWKDLWDFEVRPVDAEDVPASETPAPAGGVTAPATGAQPSTGTPPAGAGAPTSAAPSDSNVPSTSGTPPASTANHG